MKNLIYKFYSLTLIQILSFALCQNALATKPELEESKLKANSSKHSMPVSGESRELAGASDDSSVFDKNSLSKKTFDFFEEVRAGNKNIQSDSFLSDTADELIAITKQQLEDHHEYKIYPILKSKLETIAQEVEQFKSAGELSLNRFNLLGFQITFIFDELEKGKDRILSDDEFEHSFDGYFQANLGKTLVNIRASHWEQQKELLTLINGAGVVSIRSSSNPSYKLLLNTNESSHPPVYIIAGLYGVISLSDLNKGYARRQYWIGINSQSDWADGRKLSPLEFFHHDLTHAANREFSVGREGDSDRSFRLEPLFIEHLEAIRKRREIDGGRFKRVQTAFFLLTHEQLYGEIALGQDPYLLQPRGNYWFRYDPSSALVRASRFEDRNDLNGLLPKEVRVQAEDQIVQYIAQCYQDLEEEWIRYFKR